MRRLVAAAVGRVGRNVVDCLNTGCTMRDETHRLFSHMYRQVDSTIGGIIAGTHPGRATDTDVALVAADAGPSSGTVLSRRRARRCAQRSANSLPGRVPKAEYRGDQRVSTVTSASGKSGRKPDIGRRQWSEVFGRPIHVGDL